MPGLAFNTQINRIATLIEAFKFNGFAFDFFAIARALSNAVNASSIVIVKFFIFIPEDYSLFWPDFT